MKCISFKILLAFVLFSCSDIQSLENRINDLENQVEENKNNYLALKSIQDNLVSISSVTEVENGYTIVFSNGESVLITNGIHGVDGTNGLDGENGIAPHVGENGNWWLGEQDLGIPTTIKVNENPTLIAVIFDGGDLIFSFSDGDQIRVTLENEAMSDLENLFSNEWNEFVNRFNFEDGEYQNYIYYSYSENGELEQRYKIIIIKAGNQFNYKLIVEEVEEINQTLLGNYCSYNTSITEIKTETIIDEGEFGIRYTLLDQAKLSNGWLMNFDSYYNRISISVYDYFNEYDINVQNNRFPLYERNDDLQLEVGIEYYSFDYYVEDGVIYKFDRCIENFPENKIGAIGVILNDDETITINYYSKDWLFGDTHPTITGNVGISHEYDLGYDFFDDNEINLLTLQNTINTTIKYKEKYNSGMAILLDTPSIFQGQFGEETFKFVTFKMHLTDNENIITASFTD